MDKINEGHFLELLDRLHVVGSIINDHLLQHPLTEKEANIEKLILTALDNIMEAYQQVGNLDETETYVK